MIARIVFVLISLVLSVGAANAQESYLVKPGDRLAIEVLEDTSLNRQVLVLPDGNFTFPLAGTLRAGGRTPEQVERSIVGAIASNFSVSPTVYVSIVGLSPGPAQALPVEPDLPVIYILGEVNSPGPKAVQPGTTVLQALSQSGGFTRFAAIKRVQLRRTESGGRQRVYTINYKAIARGQELGTDPTVLDGDIVLVPERRLFE